MIALQGEGFEAKACVLPGDLQTQCEGFWSWYASPPRYLSRLVVFDLGDLATKPAEIPGCEMPRDLNPGRDAHPIHLVMGRKIDDLAFTLVLAFFSLKNY